MGKHHGFRKVKNTLPEYNVWRTMKQRCANKNYKYYSFYGERGIKVCEKWNESFLNFLEDMGPRPSKNHTLERIDNNGNYEKNNCRWVLMAEQNQNKRNNIYVEYKEETLVLSEAAKRANIIS